MSSLIIQKPSSSRYSPNIQESIFSDAGILHGNPNFVGVTEIIRYTLAAFTILADQSRSAPQKALRLLSLIHDDLKGKGVPGDTPAL